MSEQQGIDWNEAVRRRFHREFGELLPEHRVAQVLDAARLERTSGSAIDAGADAARSLELLIDDLKSIEEDYERAFVAVARRTQATSGQSVPDWVSEIPAPPRWAARTRTLMKRYRRLQRASLFMLGLDDFVSRADLPVVLDAVVESDSQKGDIVALELPPESGRDQLVARLGVHMNPWYAAMEYLAEFSGSADVSNQPPYAEWLQARQADHMQRITRIGKLSFMAEHIADETGCAEWQAVAYLVCGEIPELPWVRVRGVSRPAVGETWIIEVGAPCVPASQVRRAYSDAREVLTPAAPGSAESQKPMADHYELYEFVQPRRDEGESWAKIREAWNTRGDVRQYSATKAIEVAYLRARRRVEADREARLDGPPALQSRAH